MWDGGGLGTTGWSSVGGGLGTTCRLVQCGMVVYKSVQCGMMVAWKSVKKKSTSWDF